ncbi:MAG: hypothetical protein IE914_10265 [Thiotrichales bacterium]|nr:hypothetical protein [Thiotrichales bacterium]
MSERKDIGDNKKTITDRIEEYLTIVTTPRPPQQVALGEASCFNVRNNQVNDWLTQTPQAKTTVQPL